ncbi:MAG: hypothetical protein HQL22_06020, partial [Candidatus Omnitrophica bacterium]|nr:hypothetical protein [Candidatus Omnitrophota bacterium]
MIKGLFAVVAVAFVGVVGYKILEKKNPALIRKVKGSVSGVGQKVSAIIDDAKESFYEGYAQA